MSQFKPWKVHRFPGQTAPERGRLRSGGRRWPWPGRRLPGGRWLPLSCAHCLSEVSATDGMSPPHASGPWPRVGRSATRKAGEPHAEAGGEDGSRAQVQIHGGRRLGTPVRCPEQPLSSRVTTEATVHLCLRNEGSQCSQPPCEMDREERLSHFKEKKTEAQRGDVKTLTEWTSSEKTQELPSLSGASVSHSGCQIK